MTTLRHQIRIEAPLENVWGILADLASVERYNPMVSSSKVVSECAEGVGAARRCQLKPKGWVEERVWDWVPREAIGLEVSASDWPLSFMRWRTELAGDGGGTVVRQELSYHPKYGPLGALLDAVILRRKLDRSLEEVFRSLKVYAERGARLTA